MTQSVRTSISIAVEPSAAPVPPRTLDVVLVNPPWSSICWPSIQCSLMKAVARAAGHRATVRYLNVELAARLGAVPYSAIADSRYQNALAGEWLFAIAAFGGAAPADSGAFLDAHPQLAELWRDTGFDRATIDRIREVHLPALVEEWASEPGWADVDVVGFSSTFEQNVASIAIATALKRRQPHLVTVFGGANLDGPMGLEQVRSFDAIDFAVIGEGEIAFPALLAAVAAGTDPLVVKGIACRRDGAVATSGTADVIEDLDTSPLPDYDDYFSTIATLEQDLQGVEVGQRLPVETARGCWWGQKHHCTFCGLNGQTMRYRSKSPERALADLTSLSRRHEVNTFDAVDNILDLRYLPRLLQPLAETDYDFSLFYEIKANMTRQQVRTLRTAGIDMIQPGIESLSTAVLARMRKGTTMLQNVRLLKWALYYGIRVNWNLLMGFPGESGTDYDEQRTLIPLLHHLQPPGGAARIWLERFSPLFTEPSALRDVRPLPAYAFTYPDAVDCHELAYFFDYECDDLPPLQHYRAFMAAVEDWKKAWEHRPRPLLVGQRGHGWVRVHDTRHDAAEVHVLRDDHAAILLACGDRELSAAKIGQLLTAGGTEIAASRIDAVLTELRRRELVVSDGGQHLSLAVPWRVR